MRTGFVVETIDEMVAAIDPLAGNRARRLSRAGRTLYSDAAVTEGYLAIYARMMERLRNSGATRMHAWAREGQVSAPTEGRS